MDWYVGWYVSCGMIDKLVAICYMDVFNSVQFKNFNHPTRGNFVVVMAGS